MLHGLGNCVTATCFGRAFRRAKSSHGQEFLARRRLALPRISKLYLVAKGPRRENSRALLHQAARWTWTIDRALPSGS